MTCKNSKDSVDKEKVYTRLHRHEINAMIEKNPNLKLLIDTFDLITPSDLFFKDKKA